MRRDECQTDRQQVAQATAATLAFRRSQDTRMDAANRSFVSADIGPLGLHVQWSLLSIRR